ncbi:hypothetical protein ASG29_00095 [Sphingomonas sp. Leaf412]|uniref:ATP-binding protein n=1 Tax=Sphingomonas sp. Leaf412 TaxID=1736370 RepID=UPI0006F29F17|nr:ATP-binding protein [Sphingomonas sp. Leaf412]KQT34618.1 hypothetical protein ASG29_00095 [Sphingomonas sp. Leaf412]
MVWSRFVDTLLGRRPRPQPIPALDLPQRPSSRARAATSRLPRFKGEASDLERPLRGRDGPIDQQRSRLQRAFTPSQPVSDVRMFAGRREILLSLIRAIEEQQLHAVVFGDRGIGKTSLLHVFSQLAREARYIVRYASCTETSEFDAVFRAIAADVPLLYHADFDPTSDRAESGAALDSLLPDRELTVATLTEVFAKLSGTRVLIILDEFDRATSVEFKRQVAELIKGLSDRSIRVQIVIAGVAANLTELVEHIPSIRRNVLGLPMPMMTDEEMGEMIALGESIGQMSFEPDAQADVVMAAQGSPYITGLLAQHAAARALDRQAGNVSRDDVAEAIRRAMKDVWVRLSPRSQQQVESIALRLPPADIAVLAREGLRHFGVVLNPADETGPLAGALRAAAEAGMVRPATVGDRPAHRFVDDSVALYLWLAGRIGEPRARVPA